MEDSSYYGWARNGLLVRVFSILTILAVLVSMWAFVAPQRAGAVGNIEEIHDHEPDFDGRSGIVQPTLDQRNAVSRMGATVRWNKFGTPQSLIKYGDYLATGLSGDTASQAAFGWISANRGLFRLANLSTNSLRLVNDVQLTDGTDPASGRRRYIDAHAVLFRQYFGGTAAGQDGQVVVGIVGNKSAGWKVAYVSSSLTGSSAMAAQPTLSATAAWLKGAAAIGHKIDATKLSGTYRDLTKKDGKLQLRSDWTMFNVAGLSHPQRARLRALPTATSGVRPAYETIYLHNKGGHAEAFTSFVDAVTGQVLYRTNNVQQFAAAAPQAAPQTRVYQGALPNATTCSTDSTFDVPANTQEIVVTVAAANEINDIKLILLRGTGPTATEVASDDTGVGAEVVRYEGTSGVITPGKYSVRVCPSPNPIGPLLPPFNFAGSFTASDLEAGTSQPYPPKWRYFRSNPPLNVPFTNRLPDQDTRILACWDSVLGDSDEGGSGGTPVPGCQQDLDYVGKEASRVPHDFNVQLNSSTFTTTGNNATAQDAENSFLTPGPGARPARPFETDRVYDQVWQNQWNRNRCDPTVLSDPTRNFNDVLAATTNLFVFHNRMHDWSYHLGFVEDAYNMQLSNFGNQSTALINAGEGDPEVGNVQAGAFTGGPPGPPPTDPNVPAGPTGRDNANQITLNDGIPPITNMYLWQPLPTGFYAPCVDGDYDMSVVGHEYGHAIQNRMSGGPEGGLSGHQARAMGESWSDLTAVEFLFGFGYSQGLDLPAYRAGVNPFAVGPYVTGSLQAGIRNYGMNFSPLNYSDLEYDPAGLGSPHADGEIWSATNYEIRQLLVEKYNVPRFGYPAFPVTDKGLQQDCVAGRRPARFCPGNRRWIQIFHDAFLLQATGAITMLDARDTYLAADMMRFSGFNQTELWRAFARRGMGVFASSPATKDAAGKDISPLENRNPIPNFRSPREGNTLVTFNVVPQGAGGVPVKARIYVGDYEARIVPIADTIPADNDPKTQEFSNTVAFVGGAYKFLVVAPGYGHFRFTRTFAPGGRSLTLNVAMPVNYASKANGAVARGIDFINKNKLIDDTETSNAAALNLDPATGRPKSDPGPQVAGKTVTVKLAGGQRLVTRVQVSALLRPRDEKDTGDDDPEETPQPVGDTEGQGRVTALRQFEILTCRATGTTAATNCSTPAQFTKIYTSPTDAFPSGKPRPTAPTLNIRNFDVPDTQATHVRIRVLSSQCTGAPAYQGEQDNDPNNPNTDCSDYNGSLGNVFTRQNNKVRINELQVFSTNGAVSQR